MYKFIYIYIPPGRLPIFFFFSQLDNEINIFSYFYFFYLHTHIHTYCSPKRSSEMYTPTYGVPHTVLQWGRGAPPAATFASCLSNNSTTSKRGMPSIIRERIESSPEEEEDNGKEMFSRTCVERPPLTEEKGGIHNSAPLLGFPSGSSSTFSSFFDLPWGGFFSSSVVCSPYAIRREFHSLTVYDLNAPSSVLSPSSSCSSSLRCSSPDQFRVPVTVLLQPHRTLTYSCAWEEEVSNFSRPVDHYYPQSTTAPTAFSSSSSSGSSIPLGSEGASSPFFFLASGDTKSVVQVCRIQKRGNKNRGNTGWRKYTQGSFPCSSTPSLVPPSSSAASPRTSPCTSQVITSFTLWDASTRGGMELAPIQMILPLRTSLSSPPQHVNEPNHNNNNRMVIPPYPVDKLLLQKQVHHPLKEGYGITSGAKHTPWGSEDYYYGSYYDPIGPTSTSGAAGTPPRPLGLRRGVLSFSPRNVSYELGLWMGDMVQEMAVPVPVYRHPSQCNQIVRLFPVLEHPSLLSTQQQQGEEGWAQMRGRWDMLSFSSSSFCGDVASHGNVIADSGPLSYRCGYHQHSAPPPLFPLISTVTSLSTVPEYGDQCVSLHHASTLEVLWTLSLPHRSPSGRGKSSALVRPTPSSSRSCFCASSWSTDSCRSSEVVQSILRGRGAFDVLMATRTIATPPPPPNEVNKDSLLSPLPAMQPHGRVCVYHFDLRFPATPVAVYPIYPSHLPREAQQEVGQGGVEEEEEDGSLEEENQCSPHPARAGMGCRSFPCHTSEKEEKKRKKEEKEWNEWGSRNSSAKVAEMLERWKKRNGTAMRPMKREHDGGEAEKEKEKEGGSESGPRERDHGTPPSRVSFSSPLLGPSLSSSSPPSVPLRPIPAGAEMEKAHGIGEKMSTHQDEREEKGESTPRTAFSSPCSTPPPLLPPPSVMWTWVGPDRVGLFTLFPSPPSSLSACTCAVQKQQKRKRRKPHQEGSFRYRSNPSDQSLCIQIFQLLPALRSANTLPFLPFLWEGEQHEEEVKKVEYEEEKLEKGKKKGKGKGRNCKSKTHAMMEEKEEEDAGVKDASFLSGGEPVWRNVLHPVERKEIVIPSSHSRQDVHEEEESDEEREEEKDNGKEWRRGKRRRRENGRRLSSLMMNPTAPAPSGVDVANDPPPCYPCSPSQLLLVDGTLHIFLPN